jgi:hypothetical protein
MSVGERHGVVGTAAATSVSPTLTVAAGGNSVAGDKRRGRLRLWFGGPLLARRTGEREALVLTIICALDMYTTLWWVITGEATEANDNLAWTFEHHPVTFVLVKSLSCLPALLMAPRLARRHPRFTVWLLRGIIVAYVGYYLMAARF